MLALWRQGNQVVYGIRRSLKDRWQTALVRRAFYRLVNALSEDDLPLNAGEFRLVDRRILDELRRVEDTSPYLRGLISAMGFRQVGFEYDRQGRVAGESKFPFRAMLALGRRCHPQPFPGAAAAGVDHQRCCRNGHLSSAAGLRRSAGWCLASSWPRGFATTTILLLLSMTLNAMFLGIVGEYVGRIFMQSKRRPATIVEETLNSEPTYRARADAAGDEGEIVP